MLRHTQSEDATYVSPYMPVPRKDEMYDTHVEDYLDHYCAPLVGKVSYEERVKMRLQMRSELEAVIAAHMELGSSREQAIALTLPQFNSRLPKPAVNPVTVPPLNMAAPQVQQMQANGGFSQQAQVAPKRRSGVGLGFASFGLSAILTAMTLEGSRHATGGLPLLYLAMIFSFPVLAGIQLGYRRPDRALRTLVKSLGWLALPTLMMYGIVSSSYEQGGDAVPLATGMTLLGGLILGGFGVKIGTWMYHSGVLDKIDPPVAPQYDNRFHRM